MLPRILSFNKLLLILIIFFGIVGVTISTYPKDVHGQSCPSCTTPISTVANIRSDGKYDIQIGWEFATKADGYKIFRNNFVEGNEIAQVNQFTRYYTDTNGGSGYDYKTSLQYEVRPFAASCSTLSCARNTVSWPEADLTVENYNACITQSGSNWIGSYYYVIKNIGSSQAPATQSLVEFVAGPPETFVIDPIPALNPNQSQAISGVVTISKCAACDNQNNVETFFNVELDNDLDRNTINNSATIIAGLCSAATPTPTPTPTPILNNTIEGFVYEDTNQDGNKDAGEPDINNATVELYKNGILDNSKITSGGYYGFNNLTIGSNYQVRLIVPSGYMPFNPASATINITSHPGGRLIDRNFGVITDTGGSCVIINMNASDYIYSDRIALNWNITGSSDPNFDHILIRRDGADYMTLGKTSTFYTDVTGCGQGYFYRTFCAKSDGSVIAGSGPYTPPPGKAGDAADNGFSQDCITIPPPTPPNTPPPTPTPTATPTPTSAPAARWFQTLGGNAYSRGSITSLVPSGETFNINIADKASDGVSYSTSISVGSGQAGKNADSVNFPEVLSYTELKSRFDTIVPIPGASLQKNSINPVGSTGDTKVFEVPNATSLAGDWTGFSGNAVIFVNGNLAVDTNVTVDQGSFLGFVVNGNVVIDETVIQVDGFYFATGTLSTGTTGGTDTQLVLNGTFVAENFSLDRNLGSGNSTTPGEAFNYRPDFAFTAPQELRRPYRHFQEVAP